MITHNAEYSDTYFVIVNTKIVNFTREWVVVCDYLTAMDVKWFKQQQKVAGVTAEEIGMLLGRDRSVLSRIYVGRQRMTLEQAQVLANVFKLPIATILEKAGLVDATTAQQATPGFSEGDVAAWIPGTPGTAAPVKSVAAALGERPGVDIWRVKSGAMALAGLLQGDFMLVDTHQSERVKAGDIVIAQVYNRSGATTVLRRFEPPVLIAASADPADSRVFVVDGTNVVVRGKVIASWRTA